MGAAGTYLLFVVDETNGCEGKGIARVALDTVAPTALISSPEVFNCNSATALIDGSASSTGANFIYSWTTIDGDIQSKPDVISPTIGSAGTYQLEITNTVNGCVNISDVVIAEDFEEPTAIYPPSFVS